MGLSSALVEQVDGVFADMDVPQHPGAALLVIDHGERLYSKGYGLADLETQRPITADSSFYLASISKQFTAMAIMMLAEQGKLSFEDRLLAYFPQFPSWGAEITLRHMLHHTSGLPSMAFSLVCRRWLCRKVKACSIAAVRTRRSVFNA
jgi:CubicO group peptidase (beta-lactamase class C family)